jgi:secreted trypsin-like serine protease
MSNILRRRCASDTSAKLRLSFIIYCIIILFQTLLVRVLADTLVSANTVDPTHNHITNKTVSAQILGGTLANEGEFPYMAAIYLSGDFNCGGVILSSRWVLTTAQCLVDPNGTHTSTTFELYVPKSNITVGYGSIRNIELDEVSISNVWVHSKYVPLSPHYDLALIELATSLPSDGKWSPAQITTEIVSFGDELITAGWGFRENNRLSSTLQKVRLTAGSDSLCQSGYSEWDGQDGGFVCTANGRGRGACYGDRGGPLVLPNFSNRTGDFAGHLIGIASFFINIGGSKLECADGSSVINYFTRVAKYVNWIAGVMGVDSSELLTNSAESFLLKRFDGMLLSVILCSLTLAATAFNN